MRILAADTATRSCSVAVTEDTTMMAEIGLENHQTHTRHLLPMVSQVLSLADVAVGALDAVAVTAGPGSFTGLRIGISTLQGIAAALSIPLVGLSSLDVLARQALPCPYPICAMIDASRGEVYYRWYSAQDNAASALGDGRVGTVAGATKGLSGEALFIGSGARKYRADIKQQLGVNAHLAPSEGHRIRAVTLAALAMGQLEAEDPAPAAGIKPIYLRKSDAEYKRENDRNN